jgi:hypothetical protein
MSEHIYLLTIGLPLATVLLIFGMRYLAAMKQAHPLRQRGILPRTGGESRRHARETAAALADLKARVASIEKVLKEVE